MGAKSFRRDFPCIIIGAGPAALQASIQFAKLDVECCMIGKPRESNAYRTKIWNLVGVRNMHGSDIIEIGLKQALEDYSNSQLYEDNILDIIPDNGKYLVKTSTGVDFTGEYIMIATGAPRQVIDCKFDPDLVGKDIHYCAECEAFYYKDKTIVLIGYSFEILEKLKVLRNSKHIYWIPQVRSVKRKKREEEIKKVIDFVGVEKIDIIEGKVLEIKKGKTLDVKVQDFVRGKGKVITDYTVDGVFIELGGTMNPRQIFPSLKKIQADGSTIIVDKGTYETHEPNVYCVGDANGGSLQLPEAVGEACHASCIIAKKWISSQVDENGNPKVFSLKNAPSDY